MDWAAPFALDWQRVYDMGLTTVMLYALIVVAVRVLGIRAISHFNNFDWIVMVAIGAVSGSAIISPDVSALQGMVAVAMLFGVQFAVTWPASRFGWFKEVVKSNPTVLLRDGKLDHDALLAERLTEGEVLAEVRGKGLHAFEDAKLVVLEADATVSVVPKDEEPHSVAMQAVK